MISNFVAVVVLGVALQDLIIAFMFSNLWFQPDFGDGKVETVWFQMICGKKCNIRRSQFINLWI